MMRTSLPIDSFVVFLSPRNVRPALGPLAAQLQTLSDRAVLLGFSTEERRQLSKQGCEFWSERDLEKMALLEDVNGEAVRIASEWYLNPALQTYLNWESINLGSIFQRTFCYILLRVLRDIALVAGLVENSGCKNVYLVEGSTMTEANKSLDDVLRFWLREHIETDTRKSISESVKSWIARLLWTSAPKIEESWPKSSRRLLVSAAFSNTASVLNSLKANPENNLFYLREEFCLRQFSDFTKNKISFYAYSANAKPALEHEWGEFSNTVQNSSVFQFRGIPFWEFIRAEFKRKFYRQFETMKNRISFFRKFLKTKNVDAILVDEDVCVFNKSLVSVANQLGILSLVLQHGAPFELVPVSCVPVSATQFAAWGGYTRDLFLKWDVPSEKIKLVGVPRYDTYVTKTHNQQAAWNKVSRDLKLDPNKRLMVLATDPVVPAGFGDFIGLYLSEDDIREEVEEVVKAADHFKDFQLVIKLHPRDSEVSRTVKWIKELNSQFPVKIVKEYHTFTLLEACEVLITACSTVAIEAMICGKPVITINVRGGKDLQPHAELGAALGVRGEIDLISALQKIFSDKKTQLELRQKREDVLPYYIYTLDGCASERAAKLLEKLADAAEAEPEPKFHDLVGAR